MLARVRPDTWCPTTGGTEAGGPGQGRRTGMVTTTGDEDTQVEGPGADRWRSDRWVLPLAALASLLVLVSNISGIASGDDGVGYRATADSLLQGHGLGYFLERPLVIWPPVWPWLMAAVAKVTPLDTLGAAILLNAVVTFVAVVLGQRLLKRVVVQDRLVLVGTVVLAVGSSTIGFGHLLMTDFAFATVACALLLLLLNAADSGRVAWLVGAGATFWLAFGLRYASLYLLPIAGLWLLLDRRRDRIALRVRDAAVFGVSALVVPVVWMLRNHSVDGTYTGPRYPSARGLVANASDIVATLGRFLLPGVLNSKDRIWAVVAVLVLAVTVGLGLRVLLATRRDGESVLGRCVRLLGGPTGLVLMVGVGYLVYMLYVRSTTALNQLDLRLLHPAYLPLLVATLSLVAHLGSLGPEPANRWPRIGRLAVYAWAALNVAAGIVAVVGFATGNPYFDGNYERDLFDKVRDNPALEALPAGCRVESNLPNALYPRLESRWSPMRTQLESTERTDDLDRLVPTLAEHPTCLVWIDEQPRYGHLWTRDQLRRRVQLEQLAQHGDVTVYRMEPLPQTGG